MDHEIQIITCDVDYNFILHTLINVLKKFSGDQPCTILEIAYLSKFPAADEVLPIDNFSPRIIIEDMMERHGRTMGGIWRNPSLLETCVYKYRYNERIEEFKFSNNMLFYADIITICYLHYMRSKSPWLNQMWDLMMMMKKKYKINDGREMSSDPRTATFFRIAHSFPSITLGMFCHDLEDTPVPCTKFSNYNLSRAFCSPMIASIIPMLDPEYIPIALLTAIAVSSYDESKYGTRTQTPLYIIYRRVLSFYTSKAFPVSLKIELCIKWGIVCKEENKYKYTSDIIACRQRAKYLITVLRPQDRNIENILSYM